MRFGQVDAAVDSSPLQKGREIRRESTEFGRRSRPVPLLAGMDEDGEARAEQFKSWWFPAIRFLGFLAF